MKSALPQHLTRISAPRAMGVLALDWTLIVACFAAAIGFPHPLCYLVAALLIARTQLALAVLMHESAHGTLLPRRGLNDAAGQVFAAAPLMLSMFSYRDGHLRHHRAPMAADDPVAIVFGIGDYPVTRKELAWRLFKDVSGIGYFLSVYGFLRGKHRHLMPKSTARRGRAAFVIVSILATNGILLGGLAALGHAGLYLGLWIAPALTFLQVFARVRAITEHAGYPAMDKQLRNARTIVSPGWHTFFFGPHGIHYHIEHHQHARVPFYHLREVHALMKSQGILPAANLYRSYRQVLKDVSTGARPHTS
ncbi:MAG TPA: fatty acid desaturase [Janthinobacterium sp.]|nr:fatty acid desaturase [Janthinobacterium sp.]